MQFPNQYQTLHTCIHNRPIDILTMVVGRSEGVLLHGPARGKYYKVGYSRARSQTWTGKHGENTRITVIETNRIDNHEFAKIIFIRYIIAVPGDHIEDTVLLLGSK